MGKKEQMKAAIKKMAEEKAAKDSAAKFAKTPTTAVSKPFEYQIGVKPPTSKRTAKAREKRAKTRGRLPDGAKIEAIYDATARMWSGSMRVVTDEYTHSIFHTANGIFQLLEELDVLLWEWVAENAKKESAKESAGG